MATQRYSIGQYSIREILDWVENDAVPIPEIQRPFVWKDTQVRDLLDSLYKGYPVGYLIAWSKPSVKLKDGSLSKNKRIFIDGQQRVTALMAALRGQEVLTNNYKTRPICISFHPGNVRDDERFAVQNAAIAKDVAWIGVQKILALGADIYALTQDYVAKNPGADGNKIHKILHKLSTIANNHVAIIDLAENLNIDTVANIFIRVNSAGTELSQADFVMSKIAVDEKFGGNMLRKAIDYFCHLIAVPNFYSDIRQNDPDFANSEFLPKMRWRKEVLDRIYRPTYKDMLRVAFTSEFKRGKLQDLVALLSGRDFEKRQYDESIAEQSFASLKDGILAFMNKNNFENLIMILKLSGFCHHSLIRSNNAVNFAYILYLHGHKEKMSVDGIGRLVRRWYAMSVLTGLYSGSTESTFDADIRQIESSGLQTHVDEVIESRLPSTFWTGRLPQQMHTSSALSPYFIAYKAAQVRMKDKGFLSSDTPVHDLLNYHSDKHHIFPRKYLKDKGLKPGQYNQIANFAVTQSDINKAIRAKSPNEYFGYLINEQCNGGEPHYGGITDEAELRANLEANCIPESVLDGKPLDYEEFLAERRKLMALKIKKWFEGLS